MLLLFCVQPGHTLLDVFAKSCEVVLSIKLLYSFLSTAALCLSLWWFLQYMQLHVLFMLDFETLGLCAFLPQILCLGTSWILYHVHVVSELYPLSIDLLLTWETSIALINSNYFTKS